MKRNLKNALVAVAILATLLSQQLIAGPATVPTGGSFTAGKGAISTSGNAVTITQSSTRGVINWNNFSIGSNGLVTFQNGSGATLNLVNGGAISTILGSLVASGSIYLMNPQGVVIGSTGRVNTGGDFVASSLKVSKDTFMSSGPLVFQGNSGAVVKNLGTISSSGGSVFLIGGAVENSGSINAPNGSIGLGAGQSVLLKDSTSDQRVFVQANGGDVTNSGTLTAAEIELKAAGGNIYALAGNNGGQIRATGTATKNGEVWLVSTGGDTTVQGTVSAQNTDGTGGAIETSGEHLSIGGAQVSTGQGGSWLLDPVDLTIDQSAANTIASSLASTDVTISTSATGSSGSGSVTTGNGDIIFSGSPYLNWSTNHTLTLSAYRNINLSDSYIESDGSGSLILRSDNTGTGTGTINLSTGTIDFTLSSGNVTAYYNPAGSASTKYTNPLNFSSTVYLNSGQLTPYMLVNTATDLQYVSTAPSANFAVTNNIDASTVSTFLSQSNFSGIFDGQGHNISNLTVSGAGSGYFGPFQTNSGTIENLGLVNVSVTNNNANVTLGGLAGSNTGYIYDSYVNGKVAGINYAAGLVGSNSGGGRIWDNYVAGVVSAAYSAGLVANNSGTINQNYSIATAAKGLVYTNSGTVQNSYWDVNNSGTTTSAAGVGLDRGALQITSVPSGFNTSLWSTASVGGYPYLEWQVPNGATDVQPYGVAYTDQSQNTVIPNVPVRGILNGTDIGLVGYTGADGYFYVLTNTAAAPNGSGLITYLPQNGHAANFLDNLQSNGTLTIPITQGYLTDSQAVSSFTTSMGDLKAAGGSYIAANSLPFSVSASNILSLTGGTNLDIICGPSGVSLDQPLTMSNMVLEEAYPIKVFSQTSPISVTDLSLIGAGNYYLTNASNVVSVLATAGERNVSFVPVFIGGTSSPLITPLSGSFSNVEVTTASNLHLGTTDAAVGVYSSGKATIVTAGSLTIDSGIAVEANGSNLASLVLADGTTFTNSSSSTALSTPNSNWQVWSQSPLNDSRDNEAYDFKQYNATYGVTTAAESSTNGFLYTLAPTLTTTFANVSRQYNAGLAAAINTSSYSALTGAVDGDAVTLTATPASGTFNSKIVGTGNKTVTVTGLTASATARSGAATVYGYTVNNAQNTTSTITQAPLTVTTTASNKVYNGNATASGTAAITASGILGSDSVSLAAGITYAFNNPNAANGKAVTASGVAFMGADAGNYSVNLVNTTANILQKPLNVTISATDKVYDGTATAPGTATLDTSAIIGSDMVSLTGGSFHFFDGTAGTNKSVIPTGLSLTGDASGNYSINLSNEATANITPKPLSVNTSASNRVYDGTTLATGSAVLNTAGIVGSDVVSLAGGSYNFNNPNAGTAKPVTVSGLTLIGEQAGNYSISATGTTANVTPAPLTVTIAASNKVYDGTTAATGTSGSLSGVIGADAVSLSGGTYNFNDPNAGTAKPVTVSGLTLIGAQAGNYSVSASGTTANVTPAPLTVTIAASNKVYDGTAAATGTSSLGGVIGEDAVSLSGGSYLFNNANAGTNKPVTVSGLTLTGAAAGNYTINPENATTATITPAPLSVTTAINGKVYDGTTVATGSSRLGGVIGEDTVTLSGGSYLFVDPNAGTNKPVTVAGLTLGGASAGNYTLVLPSGVTGNITPATLTVSTSVSNKVYDGTTAATGSSFLNVANIIGGDLVRLGPGATYLFSDANVGNSKEVTISGLTLIGASAGNYAISLQGPATGNITPASLYYLANPASRAYGLNNPLFTGSITGLVGNDTLASVVSGTPLFSSAATPTSALGTYAILGSGLTLMSGNYTLNQSAANLNALSVGPLTLAINNSTHAAGQANAFTLSYNGSGSLAIDLSSLLGSIQFQTNPVNSSNAGLYAVTASYAGSLSNAFVFTPGLLTVTGGATAPPPPIPPVLYTPPPPLTAPALSVPLAPNITGQFEVSYSAAFDWTSTLVTAPLYTNALTSSSSFLTTPTSETKPKDYAAGIHP